MGIKLFWLLHVSGARRRVSVIHVWNSTCLRIRLVLELASPIQQGCKKVTLATTFQHNNNSGSQVIARLSQGCRKVVAMFQQGCSKVVARVSQGNHKGSLFAPLPYSNCPITLPRYSIRAYAASVKSLDRQNSKYVSHSPLVLVCKLQSLGKA